MKNKIKIQIYRLFASGVLPSWLLFLIFPKYYKPELMKVIHGNLRYFENDLSSIRYLVRRNIHRIEKGINSYSRRSQFGGDYIDSTVELYLSNKELFDKEEIEYIELVLSEYCRITGYTINTSEVQLNSSSSEWKSESRVKYDHLVKLVSSRRSARFFTEKILDEEEIFRDAFNIPSACNRIPFRVINLKDSRIRKLTLELADGLQGNPGDIKNAFVVVGDYSAYISEADRHLIYIDSSYYIYLWQLLAFTKGIGSCILNYSENYRYDKKIEELLKLAPHEKLINFVIYGEVSHTLVPSSHKPFKYSEH